ncbi:MAG: acyltransferase [Novosphingobium sp.]
MEKATEPWAKRSPATENLPNQRAEKKVGSRSLDIDRAKGLGIALVVWGHLASTSTPDMPTWFYVSVGIIYGFHMPFFMYLSGFVFFMSGSQERFWNAPAKQIVNRFDRLMIPCLAFGTLVVIGKYFAQAIGPVDDQVNDIGSGILKIITNAPGNPALSVWYLFVLFVYTMAAPVLWRFGNRTLTIILLLGSIGWLLPLPDTYYLNRIGTYFIFFGVGGLFAMHRELVLPMLAKWCLPALLVFAAACYIMLSSPFALLVCGLASIPALHGLFLQRFWSDDKLMLTLGRNSMAIYLMNTIAIGITKLIYLRYLPYENLWFFLFIGVAFTMGIIGPMMVRSTIGAIPQLHSVKRYLD